MGHECGIEVHASASEVIGTGKKFSRSAQLPEEAKDHKTGECQKKKILKKKKKRAPRPAIDLLVYCCPSAQGSPSPMRVSHLGFSPCDPSFVDGIHIVDAGPPVLDLKHDSCPRGPDFPSTATRR